MDVSIIQNAGKDIILPLIYGDEVNFEAVIEFKNSLPLRVRAITSPPF